jgi:hypothetical protein
MWLDKMARNDLWKQYDGSGNKAADASDAEEQKATEQRKSQRLQNFIDLSKDEFVTIQRRCGERVNNAGMPEGSP